MLESQRKNASMSIVVAIAATLLGFLFPPLESAWAEDAGHAASEQAKTIVAVRQASKVRKPSALKKKKPVVTAPAAADNESTSFHEALDLPYTQEPNKLHVDFQDRFYLDWGTKIVRWKNGEDRIFRYGAPQGWSIDVIDNQVDPTTGTIHSLRQISRTECREKNCKTSITYWQYHFIQCAENGKCLEKQLVSWSRSSEAKSYTTYDAAHRVTEAGNHQYSLTRTEVHPKKSRSKTSYFCAGKKCGGRRYENMYYNEMVAAPHYRVNESKDNFLPGTHKQIITGPDASRMGETISRALAMIDRSVVYDRAGRAHIFFHDPADRGFSQLYIDETLGAQRTKRRIDSAEAGTSNAVVRWGDKGLIVFHYFYRNSFYKGIRVTIFEDAALPPTDSFVWRQSNQFNPGWRLKAAATPQGRVLVGYLRDPQHDKRYQLRLFTNAEQIVAERQTEPEGWEKNYVNWFLQSGAGAWYAMWYFDTEIPEGISADQKPDYDIPPSLLAEASVEARYDRFNLGASYVKSFIRERLEEQGGETAMRTYDRLQGLVGWDDIFAYHSLRVGYRYGQIATDYSLAGDTRIIESTYQRFDAFFLNTWRIRYGLFYQTYKSRLPVGVWYIAKGSKEYEAVDFFHTDVQFQDYGATIGYSRLDYAAKYENKVFDWFLDADLGFGFCNAKFTDEHEYKMPGDQRDKVITQKIDNSLQFMLPFNFEGGLLYYKRYYAAYGFGWYARGGYRLEGSYAGKNDKPSDKDEAAEESSLVATFQRTELRHGPFFNLGIVF